MKIRLGENLAPTTNDFCSGGDGYTMLGGAREEGLQWMLPLKTISKQLIWLSMKKVNGANSRAISVDSKTFKLPEEGKEQDPAKPVEDQATNRLNLLL